MKRGKNEKKIRWRKDGGGTFRMGSGKIIKPGQTFDTYPSQIPEAFRDTVIALDKIPEKEQEELVITQPKYELKEKDTKGWFDVIGPGGTMNESGLRRQAALDLIKGLE